MTTGADATDARLFKLWLAILGVALVTIPILLGEAARRYGPEPLADARMRFEAEVGPLDLAKYALPDVPDDGNAATWISRSAELMPDWRVRTAEFKTAADLASRSIELWTDADVAALRDTLDATAPAFELVARARGLRESTFRTRVTDGIAAKHPPLLKIVTLARLHVARARLRLRDGDATAAVDDLETLGSVSGALHREPILISAIIGTACERMQIAVLREMAQRPEMQLEELARAGASLPPEDLLVTSAKAHAYDTAALLRSFDQILDRQPLLEMLGPRRLIDRYATIRAATGYLEFHRSLAAILGRPYPEFSRAYDELVSTTLREYPAYATVWIGQDKSTYGRFTHLLSLRRLARTAIALREEGAAGRYPETLDGIEVARGSDPFTGGSATWKTTTDFGGRLEVTMDAAWLEDMFHGGEFKSAVSGPWALPPPRRDKSGAHGRPR